VPSQRPVVQSNSVGRSIGGIPHSILSSPNKSKPQKHVIKNSNKDFLIKTNFQSSASNKSNALISSNGMLRNTQGPSGNQMQILGTASA